MLVEFCECGWAGSISKDNALYIFVGERFSLFLLSLNRVVNSTQRVSVSSGYSDLWLLADSCPLINEDSTLVLKHINAECTNFVRYNHVVTANQ